MSLRVEIRRYGLFAVTALARQTHEHGHHLWHSAGDFLLAWLWGYLVIVGILLPAGVVISMWSAWFLDGTRSTSEPDMDQIIVYVTLALLTIAVGYLVLPYLGTSHSTPT